MGWQAARSSPCRGAESRVENHQLLIFRDRIPRGITVYQAISGCNRLRVRRRRASSRYAPKQWHHSVIVTQQHGRRITVDSKVGEFTVRLGRDTLIGPQRSRTHAATSMRKLRLPIAWVRAAFRCLGPNADFGGRFLVQRGNPQLLDPRGGCAVVRGDNESRSERARQRTSMCCWRTGCAESQGLG
jgi:hypothetical protein